MDDVKELMRASKALRITERVGSFLIDDAASAGLTDPADVLGKIKTASKQAKSLKRIETLLNTEYKGAWSPGTYGDATKNLDRHFFDHGKQFGLSGNPSDLVGKQQYVDLARNLINKRADVEVYYQTGKDNMLIYNRINNELAIGKVVKDEITKVKTDQIQTLFKPDPVKKNGIEINYVDNLVSEGKAIKIRG